MDQQQIVLDAVQGHILSALEQKEARLDAEIEKFDKMTEDDYEEIRRKRLEAMKSGAKKRQEMCNKGHGQYAELPDEKAFFQAAKESRLMVCHFYRPTTWRCEIIDKHMMLLAQHHIGTRFVKINAERCPYLCDKLKIWCIPTLMLIKDGKTEHSIVGFDELGGKDDFHTRVLEERLADFGLVEQHN
eukprot:GDKI01025001.1.p1 GENE.GDKI01025001.1~~GDKI01025001.1.p1  ORF type:complete len:209 (-),score=67.71 GDKI01025001.1:19-579(-)